MEPEDCLVLIVKIFYNEVQFTYIFQSLSVVKFSHSTPPHMKIPYETPAM